MRRTRDAIAQGGTLNTPLGDAKLEERPAEIGDLRLTLPTCLRCGFPVSPEPWGCKHPCPNCHFTYPLGDCSD